MTTTTDVERSRVREAIEAVWSTMLGLRATDGGAAAPARPAASTLTGCVQITGAWRGAVTVECSGGLARRVASIMFGEDALDVTGDQINDALGELTNVVGGNIKALLPEPSYLSMPAVAEGTDYLFGVPEGRRVSQWSFDCEGKPFHVTILEDARGSS